MAKEWIWLTKWDLPGFEPTFSSMAKFEEYGQIKEQSYHRSICSLLVRAVVSGVRGGGFETQTWQIHFFFFFSNKFNLCPLKHSLMIFVNVGFNISFCIIPCNFIWLILISLFQTKCRHQKPKIDNFNQSAAPKTHAAKNGTDNFEPSPK